MHRLSPAWELVSCHKSAASTNPAVNGKVRLLTRNDSNVFVVDVSVEMVSILSVALETINGFTYSWVGIKSCRLS